MNCEICEKDGGEIRIAFARLEVPGYPPICMSHLRLMVEMMLFLAREGPQGESDIDQHLLRFEELYPYPKKVVK